MPDRTNDDLDRIDEMVDAATYRQAIGRAMHGLSPANRDAVRLRVLEDLPFAEVARRLGCSEGAARVRVHRGLDRLARELETSGEE
jgi:RNA polymerase sigma-70 factor (ECF subfamily)